MYCWLVDYYLVEAKIKVLKEQFKKVS